VKLTVFIECVMLLDNSMPT